MKIFLSICFAFVLSFGVYAGPKLGATHHNKEFNYTLKIPAKWKGLPVQPGEKYAIDKFQGYVRIEGIMPEMDIMAFDTVRKVVTENTGISYGDKPKIPSADDFLKNFEEKNRATNFDEFLKKFMPGGPKIRKRYEIPWKRARNGKAQVYEIGFDSGHNQPFYMFVGVYRSGNVEFAVRYTVAAKKADKSGSTYVSSLKTFRLTKEATGIKRQVIDITKLPPSQRRAAAKKNLPKGWYAYDTKNYVILSNVKKKALIKEVGKHLELIRKEYEKKFPPRKKIEALSVVRICATRNEYIGYGGSPSSAGYFHPGTKEMVLYDDSKRDKQNTFLVLYHECFHQYTYYFFGETSPHRWYGEGLGDYFAGAKLKNGKFNIKKNTWRTETARDAILTGKGHSVKKLVNMPRSEFYGPSAGMCYAQAWALIYFLVNTRNQKWNAIIQRYIDNLMETKNKDEAVKFAFEGINYDKINAAYEKFVRGGFKTK